MWKVWRPIYRWENLCPVVVSEPIGFFLLMRRADQPISFEDIKRATSEDYDYYPDIDVEYKSENWGRIGNKIVCLDYGIEEAVLVKERRAYLEDRRGRFGVT